MGVIEWGVTDRVCEGGKADAGRDRDQNSEHLCTWLEKHIIVKQLEPRKCPFLVVLLSISLQGYQCSELGFPLSRAHLYTFTKCYLRGYTNV